MTTTLPTFDELYDAGKAEVQARRPALTDFNEGSVNDAYVGAGAMLADEVIGVLVALFKDSFVDTAEGSALDSLALDRFGLSRLAASASIGAIEFARGDSTGALPIYAGTRISGTVNGVTVTVATIDDAVMPATEDEVLVPARCSVTGATGNVAEDVLDTLLDAIVGDADVEVINPARFVGGDVEESDAEFRERIRRYQLTLRKGTIAALEAGALSVAGVQYATVDETFVDPDVGGYVSVYVGDPDGNGNDTLADLVDVELDNWRACGVEVRVFGAAREEVELELTVRYRRGANVGELGTAIRAGVVAYGDGIGPGKKLYLSGVQAAAHDASTAVLSVEVTSHTADITPDEVYNALRVNAEDVAISFVEVA